jgi:hypothetical protein
MMMVKKRRLGQFVWKLYSVGANNTGHSARFHSISTSAEGNLDYYINFSTLAGSKIAYILVFKL